jgi:hypothetical protein
MIGMSRGAQVARVFFRAVALAVAVAAGGCCGGGGGSAHKCDFTPAPTSHDGGSDAPVACGTDICQPPQVCCLKKSPLLALCIDVENFEKDGCEKPENFDCLVPAECPAGLSCCFKLDFSMPTAPKCLPAMYCPNDGATAAFTCAVPQDCPPETPTCTLLGAGQGAELRICTP